MRTPSPARSPAILLAVVLSGSLVLPPAALADSVMLDEIEVRGKKESPREESLTMREVRESPARDMGEALKGVEGINVVRKGAIANDVVLRGFQRDNINVLIDGARLHGACPNRMDSPSFHYDFAEIEQVKVTKGPYDLKNPGSMGGLVEAITKKPRPGLGTDLNLTYGSYHSLNASGVVSYGAQAYDALGGYAYKRSGVPRSGDGKAITDIYGPTSANRYKPGALDSKAYEISTGWGKVGVNPSKDSRMDFTYSYQDARHVLYPYLLMDADYDRTQMLNWDFQRADISPEVRSLGVQVFWNRVDHLMDDRDRASSTPSASVTKPFSMQSDAKTQTLGAKLNGSFALGGGKLCGGLDYYQRRWSVVNLRSAYTGAGRYTPLNMIPDAVIDNGGLYAEYETPLSDRTELKGGVRGDAARAHTGKDNPLVPAFTDRVYVEGSANLQLTHKPAAGVELFAGIARATRLPDQKELFISIPGTKNTFGNPDLRPTKNYEADLGAKYASGRFYVSASVFYSYLVDYINLRGFQSGAVSNITYENIQATLWGGEFGSQVALPWDLFLKASLSYTEGRNRNGGRPLSEIPPLKGTGAVRYDNGLWFAEAAENAAARQYRVDATLQESPTAGWETTDLKAGVSYQAWSLYGGVNNVFDRLYFSYLSYLRDPFASGMKVPENGRNFYVTAAYRF